MSLWLSSANAVPGEPVVLGKWTLLRSALTVQIQTVGNRQTLSNLRRVAIRDLVNYDLRNVAPKLALATAPPILRRLLMCGDQDVLSGKCY